MTGNADPTSVLHSDLILPSDESIQRALSINLESLNLSIAADSASTAPETTSPITLGHSSQTTSIQTYSAELNYILNIEHEDQKEINIPLRYDVYFATAHPCLVAPNTEQIMSQGRPGLTIQTGMLLETLVIAAV